jgi:hypothetical protein
LEPHDFIMWTGVIVFAALPRFRLVADKCKAVCIYPTLPPLQYCSLHSHTFCKYCDNSKKEFNCKLYVLSIKHLDKS